MHRHVYDVSATPVVADEVDRVIDLLQLTFKPVTVGEVGGREVVGQWRTKPRRRQSHHVRAPKGVD
jgi:hypothetical protein